MNAAEVPEAPHLLDWPTLCCKNCGLSFDQIQGFGAGHYVSCRTPIREGADTRARTIAEATEAARGDH